MTRVLMVLTDAKTWTTKNGFPHPTGFWSEGFMRSHKAFTEGGFEVALATPLVEMPGAPIAGSARFGGTR